MLSPRFSVPFPTVRSRPAWLAAFGLVLVALLSLAGCGDRDADRTAPPPAVEPQDMFQRRAPLVAAPRPAGRRILVVGDSLSISLGEQLERALAGSPGLDFTWDGTRSTGLTRPELLNWPQRLEELAGRLTPDIVIIMIGANDTMPVDTPEGGRTLFGDPDWARAYTAKAEELLAICRRANPRVSLYWVGVPSMGEPVLADGVRQVNAALRAMCQVAGCQFIDTHAVFSDEDNHFSRHARDAATGDMVTIRTADAVHLTESGARLLAGVVLGTVMSRENITRSGGMDELLARSRDLVVVPDPGPAPAKTPTARPKASGKVHTVRQGETMAAIARCYGVSEQDMVALNPDADARRLSIGQKLRLPRR